MSGPPEAVPAFELWEKLTSAERPSREVPFPRNDPMTGEPLGKIALWVLTQGEIMQAKADAMTWVRALQKEKIGRDEYVEGLDSIFNDACSVEILFRAARRPGALQHPAFPTPSAARLKLTSDEMAVLVNQYAVVQRELGPIVADMSEAEMEAWLSRLEEGGSAAPLAFFSSGQKDNLIMFSASRWRASPTVNSSPGEPPADGTTETKPAAAE